MVDCSELRDGVWEVDHSIETHAELQSTSSALNLSSVGKVCGCYLICFSCSPTSTEYNFHNETCVALANP